MKLYFVGRMIRRPSAKRENSPIESQLGVRGCANRYIFRLDNTFLVLQIVAFLCNVCTLFLLCFFTFQWNQAECGELSTRVDSLMSENTSLRAELDRLSAECKKLAAENEAMMVSLKWKLKPISLKSKAI